MAFTYDLATDRGKVRLRLGDTSSTAYVFEDAEIDYFLTSGGSVSGAVGEALRTLLASKAYRVKYANIQGVVVNDTQQIAALQAALTALGPDGYPRVSSVLPDLIPSDQGYVEEVS